MQSLTEAVLGLAPPGGLFDETVLANLYPDRSAGARNALAHRAVSSREVLRLKPGLYCLARRYSRSPAHPFLVAAALHSPSHVSMESALWHHGLLPEALFGVASVTTSRGRRYSTPVGEFEFFKVVARPPMVGVTSIEVEPRHWGFVADPLRALADLLYLRRQVSWQEMGPDFVTNSLRIDLDELAALVSGPTAPIVNGIGSPRVRLYLRNLIREMGL